MPLAATSTEPIRYARTPGADETLVAAFKAGDVRAFDALFARYRQPIFGYIYRSIGDFTLAEEMTQDVFLKVFLHLRQMALATPFKAWIYRIATTTCIDVHCAASRRPAPVRDEEALTLVANPHASDPEQRAIQHEQRRAVRRTLDAMPAHYRQALILRQLQGLSYSEVAEALGISIDAVTSLIHRARQAFRTAYSRRQQEIER